MVNWRQKDRNLTVRRTNMETGMKYAHILQPLRVGNTLFRNRIFSAPTGLYDLTPALAPTDDYIAYFERKAKGGCASVNIGECNIDDEGIGSHRYICNSRPINKH